jgi:hypothetical protein
MDDVADDLGGESVAGGKIEAGETHWNSLISATNSSGFHNPSGDVVII